MAKKLTLTEAQRLLLGIISNVELGELTPDEAVKELVQLKLDAAAAGFEFKVNYTFDDFERLRENYISNYESSSEESVSASTSY